uniref:Uncharacterized protein n=1 Tax=Lotus japonicus TaxID=34305 RepID=I3SBS8_LOTJA|nr:unknown [Lotus japonicus]
MHLMPGAT